MSKKKKIVEFQKFCKEQKVNYTFLLFITKYKNNCKKRITLPRL